MDVVLIFNGLGNQMSQYAFYLAKKNAGCKCMCMFDPDSSNRHNGSELEKLFGIEYENSRNVSFYNKIIKFSRRRGGTRLLKLFGVFFVNEPLNYNFSETYLRPGKGWLNIYIGGWHSEKYFRSIRDIVLSQFTFDTSSEDDKAFNCIDNQIKSNYSNSVSIHVRRGDYLLSKQGDTFQYGGVATMEYYQNAISYMNSKFKNAEFFVFSNDIEWCMQNFVGNEFHFVSCNNAGKSWRDMYLMSICKHHIIANSSFSWWGAWLCCDEESITIRPERFLANRETRDFYPANWIIVKSVK